MQLSTGNAQKALNQIETSLGELQVKLNSFTANNGLEQTLNRISAIRLDNTTTASIGNLSKALNNLSKAGDLSKVAQSLNALANVNVSGVVSNISALGTALASIRSPAGLATAAKNIDALKSAANGAAAPIAAVGQALGTIQAPAGLRNATGQLNSAAGGANNFRSALSSTSGILNGFGIALGGVGIAQFVRQSFEAVRIVDQFGQRIRASGDGTLVAGQELDYLKTTVKNLALPFGEAASAYSKIVSSVTSGGRPVSDARNLFEGFGTVFRVLGLNAEQAGRGFNAVTQIIDKGSVSMEELRQQLGELFPAFTLLAKSMGISTKELANMMQQGQVSSNVLFKFADDLKAKFGGELANALKTSQAAWTNLSNAVLFVQEAFGRGFFDALVPGFNALANAMSSPAFTNAVQVFGSIAGTILGGLLQGVLALATAFPPLTAAVAGLAAIALASRLLSWVAALGVVTTATATMGNAFAVAGAKVAASSTVAAAGVTRLSAAFAALRAITLAGIFTTIVAGIAALGVAIYPIITLITALTLGFGYLYNQLGSFSATWAFITQQFQLFGQFIGTYLMPIWNQLSAAFQYVASAVMPYLNAAIATFQAGLQAIGADIQWAIDKTVGWDNAVAAVTATMAFLNDVINSVLSALQGLAAMFGLAATEAEKLASSVAKAAESAFSGTAGMNQFGDSVAKVGKNAAGAELPLLASAGAIENMGNYAFQTVEATERLASSLNTAGSSAEYVAGASDAANGSTQGLASAFDGSANSADNAADAYQRAAAAAQQAQAAGGGGGGGAGGGRREPYVYGQEESLQDGGFGMLREGFKDSAFDTFLAAGGAVTRAGGPKGVRASAPASLFANAPKLAEGTANTDLLAGGGIPAILHPNEAVIPLTGGGAVPVDMSGVQQQQAAASGASRTQVSGSGKGISLLNDQLEAQRTTATEAARVYEAVSTNTALLDQRGMKTNEWLNKIHTEMVKFNAKMGGGVGGSGGGGSSGGSSGGGSSGGPQTGGGLPNVQAPGGGFSPVEQLISQLGQLDSQKPKGGQYFQNGMYIDSSGKLYMQGYGPDAKRSKEIRAQKSRAIQDYVAEYGGSSLPEHLRKQYDPTHGDYGSGGTGFSGFATGSPNASKDMRGGGFRAILHPDEAVIPLPDGRRVPVDIRDKSNDSSANNGPTEAMRRRFMEEMGGGMRQSGGGTTNITVQINVTANDVESFRKSEDQIVQELETKLSRTRTILGTKPTVDDPTRLTAERRGAFGQVRSKGPF